jgi:hypothetical protein
MRIHTPTYPYPPSPIKFATIKDICPEDNVIATSCLYDEFVLVNLSVSCSLNLPHKKGGRYDTGHRYRQKGDGMVTGV